MSCLALRLRAGHLRSPASRAWWGCSSIRCRCGLKLPPGQKLRSLLATNCRRASPALMAHQHLGLAEIQADAGLGELLRYPGGVRELSNRSERPCGHCWRCTGLSNITGHNASHYSLSVAAAASGEGGWSCGLSIGPDLFDLGDGSGLGGTGSFGWLQAAAAEGLSGRMRGGWTFCLGRNARRFCGRGTTRRGRCDPGARWPGPLRARAAAGGGGARGGVGRRQRHPGR